MEADVEEKLENENEQQNGKSKKIFLNIVIFLIILLLGIYLYARYVEPSKLVVKEYRISNENIPSNFSGIKIIHISDIYYGNTINIEYISKIVEEINEISPDLVIFTGNLLNNKAKASEELVQKLSEIEATLGKYAVKGNTDYSKEYDGFMDQLDFKILNNEYELVYNNGLTPIYICGLESTLKKPINSENCLSYFENLNEENNYNANYKIFIVHEGDAAKTLLKNSVKPDLILAGNSLNGSINVPYYGPLIIPKGSSEFFGEYYKRDTTDIYVSNGIGTDKYPYRLFNPPSFTLYRLKSLQ